MRGKQCPSGLRSESDPASGSERIHIPIDEKAGGGGEVEMEGADVGSVSRCRAMMVGC